MVDALGRRRRLRSNGIFRRHFVRDQHHAGLCKFQDALTSATSLPATPPYRPPFWCSYCVRLPPQQRHLEDVGFKTLHIDSLYIWLFFYVIDQRPIRQNVYITRGFFLGVASCLEDLGRVPGTFIVLFL